MRSVLIVDDTKNIRMLLTACLEVEGFRVDAASNGKDALEKLSTNKYDLAFLDIKLPEISGTEVLRSMRNAGVNIPVIIMTAFATVKNAVECTKLGAVHYLQKPFTAEKVRSVLNTLRDPDECAVQGKEAAAARKLIEAGRSDEAYDILRQCLAQDPEDGEIYNLLGILFEKQGQREKANKFYKFSREFSN